MGAGLRKLATDDITRRIIGAAIDVHRYVLSYLRFADLHVGLLFNFNVEVLAAGGWKRVLRER